MSLHAEIDHDLEVRVIDVRVHSEHSPEDLFDLE